MCQKLGMEYWAGNGDFWFEKGEMRIGTALAARYAGLPDLAPLLELLGQEVYPGANQLLGYFVANVLKRGGATKPRRR